MNSFFIYSSLVTPHYFGNNHKVWMKHVPLRRPSRRSCRTPRRGPPRRPARAAGSPGCPGWALRSPGLRAPVRDPRGRRSWGSGKLIPWTVSRGTSGHWTCLWEPSLTPLRRCWPAASAACCTGRRWRSWAPLGLLCACLSLCVGVTEDRRLASADQWGMWAAVFGRSVAIHLQHTDHYR